MEVGKFGELRWEVSELVVAQDKSCEAVQVTDF